MYDLVSLGEVMLRMSPPGHERLRRATALQVRLCGAQFNVAANLAVLGRRTVFLSKLPDNELGIHARDACRAYGVDVSHIPMVPDSRIGLVFVEFGAEPRPGVHFYDRQGSAASTIRAGDFDWRSILRGARLAYSDGIFLSLNENCRQAALAFVQAAKQENCKFCFDMNYRESLWDPATASREYQRILPCVDVLVTNHNISKALLGSLGSDEDIARCYRAEFGCRTVCVTSRQMSGFRKGAWQATVLHDDQIFQDEPVEFENVDRFGTGDAFFSGFLDGYLEGDAEAALRFGKAFCALAHTVEGDVANLSREEILAVVRCSGTPYLKR
jgi:2-dehydro-3-deoxygluconokinase